MIQFPCRCKHLFEFPDDMAGKQVQCPNCQLLVDIPSMDELSQLSEDGTFRVDAAPAGRSPEQFEEMRRAFSRRKVDENGLEVDLRQTAEQIAAAGTNEPIDDFENFPTAPRYDPETGELLRPLQIRSDDSIPPHPSQIPLAQTTLNYGTADPNAKLSLCRPLLQLLTPINLAVMFFVLLTHLFLILVSFSVLVIFAILLIGTGLIAHYANVIEEVGVEERDELPRFLRQFNFTDDVLLPCAHVLLAWIICFGLGRVVWIVWAAENWPVRSLYPISLALDSLGLVFFPAVVLTIVTSGSLLNLRPDRLLGTIAQIGPRYAYLVLLYAVAIAVYVFGVFATLWHAMFVYKFVISPIALPPSAPTTWFSSLGAAYEMLIVGIFLMHYFAWLLGLAYRTGHEKFPWVFHHRQRIIPGVNAPRHAKPVHSPPPIHNPAPVHPPSE
ncbi:MAG: hypothetical protein ABSC42_14790 [Tepidisphaeraceae bacterium]|jgi:hypothetical protein